jgi:hypothetical protein
MSTLGAQFDILCDDIKHLFDPGSPSENFNGKLIDIIKHHREIIRWDQKCTFLISGVSLCGFRFAANTNKFANWIVLAQFFTSAVTIGITLFQMTVVR